MIARCASILALAAIVPASLTARDVHDTPDTGDRLGLVDLPAYAEALKGRATAGAARPSDPPVEVSFRDLWHHPDHSLGRRVTIRGRLERTFRQGPVGQFPPLAESWIFSTTGDPFCAVFPWTNEDLRQAPGRPVRFTGTFLRMVRYAAGDGDRLAPLIVGDRPPAPDPKRPSTRSHPPESSKISPGNTALALALLAIAAMLVATRHLRSGRPRTRIVRGRPLDPVDPPLQFVDPPDDRP